MTRMDLLAHDVASLRGISFVVAMAALDACLAGNNMPLRRMGFQVTREMGADEALRVVAEYSAGQAQAWLLTADAEDKSVLA